MPEPTDVDRRLRAKLADVTREYHRLNNVLADPVIASDPRKSLEITKQAGAIRRTALANEEYSALQKRIDEAHAIIAEGKDKELVELAEMELAELEGEAQRQWDRLKDSLLAGDDSIRSIIMEIRAGTGGEEAALFARDLYEMYLRYCQKRRFAIEVLDQSAAEAGGLKEVIMNVRGDDVWQSLGYEGGGHRVQRVPKTEAQGRVHTSAATVAVLPEPEEISIEINWSTDVEKHRQADQRYQASGDVH